MNKLTIIGNLTRDPELRTTSAGINVCDFTVAVNRRVRRDAQNAQPEADFFRVSAWRQLGENCARFLAKGRKVCVVGPVSVRTYTGSDGTTRASLEVTAEDVEFLTPRNEADSAGAYAPAAPVDAPSAEAPAAGFTAVETDELPF
jgi:single-strand DNA-binding protein